MIRLKDRIFVGLILFLFSKQQKEFEDNEFKLAFHFCSIVERFCNF